MKYSVLVMVSWLSFLPFYGQTVLRFDGEDDYVNLNSLSTLMDTLDVFTIDFWVKFDSNENTDYGVFFSSNSASNENIFLIRVGNGGFDPVNGSAVVYINDSGNNYISGTSNIGDNECHHIAFSYFNTTDFPLIDIPIWVFTPVTFPSTTFNPVTISCQKSTLGCFSNSNRQRSAKRIRSL